ncbi:MAG: RNA polymerase sigma factor [Clostridia bacterium]|nr:RNA polymerase sigma factor [Clostridia bacterium]
MEDNRIVELYHQRDEAALQATREKYGHYLYAIAYGILQDAGGAEECVNDTYLCAWQQMPPQQPRVLSAFLGTVTRRLALDRYRQQHAEKRGGGVAAVSLAELEECVPTGATVYDGVECRELAAAISAFLHTLPREECDVFLRRYWYMDSISAIAQRNHCSQGRIRILLMRTRQKLCKHLQQEGMME